MSGEMCYSGAGEPRGIMERIESLERKLDVMIDQVNRLAEVQSDSAGIIPIEEFKELLAECEVPRYSPADREAANSVLMRIHGIGGRRVDDSSDAHDEE